MKKITVKKEIFVCDIDNRLFQDVCDIMYHEKKPDVGCFAELDYLPKTVLVKNTKKYDDFLDYLAKQKNDYIKQFNDIFIKLWLYNKIKIVDTKNGNSRDIESADELIASLIKLKNDIGKKSSYVFLILEEMQCIFLLATERADNDILQCGVYFYNEQHVDFVKNIVQTEGLYLRFS